MKNQNTFMKYVGRDPQYMQVGKVMGRVFAKTIEHPEHELIAKIRKSVEELKEKNNGNRPI